MYARIVNENISQVIHDYNSSLGDLVEIPIEIANDAQNYKYINGEFIYSPRIIIPTIQEIDNQVVKKIRERYDGNEEYKMLRFGIINPLNPYFITYNNYVEECRQWGQSEKQKYGLIE